MSTKKSATFSNYRWSANDETVCYNLVQEGKTYDQIAKALGRSKRAVQNHLFVLREKRKQEGKPCDDLHARPLRPKRYKPRKSKYYEEPENLPSSSVSEVRQEPRVVVQQSNPEQNWQSTAIAIFTGGCFVTLVVMTVLLIAIS